MRALLAIHPVLGTPLPPATSPVPLEARDWHWAGNARRRLRLVAAVLAHRGRICHLCGQPGATTADHVIPWSHGGRNAMSNLQPAHSGCNSSRQDKTLTEWFARHPVRTRPALQPSRKW